MKKIIIKEEWNATDKNIVFKGEKRVYYYGKREKDMSYNNGVLIPCRVEECGFKTKASAMKAFKDRNERAKWENEYGEWNVTVELVEVEV